MYSFFRDGVSMNRFMFVLWYDSTVKKKKIESLTIFKWLTILGTKRRNKSFRHSFVLENMYRPPSYLTILGLPLVKP